MFAMAIKINMSLDLSQMELCEYYIMLIYYLGL